MLSRQEIGGGIFLMLGLASAGGPWWDYTPTERRRVLVKRFSPQLFVFFGKIDLGSLCRHGEPFGFSMYRIRPLADCAHLRYFAHIRNALMGI